jgi:hypothetical protein
MIRWLRHAKLPTRRLQSVKSKADPSTALIVTARALALERVCAEVVSAWRVDGIEPILLKGPTIASWLYPEGLRGFGDVDLLVPPERLLDATGVLRRLGFVPHTQHDAVHAHPWTRVSDGATVDLHVALWGALRPATEVWEELRHWVEHEQVGGTSVAVLTVPARALYVVIHAAQHGDLPKPREDLRRALKATPEEIWPESVELADRLWALEAMSLGLSLDPAGQELARRHPLILAADVRSRTDARLAIAVARISSARGIRKKLGLAMRLLASARADYDGSGFALGRNVLRTVQTLRRVRERP